MTWWRDDVERRKRLAEHGGSARALGRATGVHHATISDWEARSRRHSEIIVPPSLVPAVAASERRSPELWGLGGPGTLELGPPKRGDDYTVVGLFDLHGDKREQGCFEAALAVVERLDPDLVILGGDEINFDIISRWQHAMLKRMTPLQLLREINRELVDYQRGILQRIREVYKGVLVGVEGNHSDRCRKYLSDDLQEGWDAAREWMDPDKLVDKYYTRAGVFIRPKFLVRHGHKTGKNLASREYADTKCSGWTGHDHHAAHHFEPPFPYSDENHQHTVAPCMCRLDANYGPGNAGVMRWHQGFLVGTFSASDPHDHATEVAWWRNDRLLFRGERIAA